MTAASDGEVVALVLAAGMARRYGATKVLAELDGRPLLAHVVATATAAGLPVTIVVPPADGVAGSVAAVARALRATTVENPRPRLGLASSLAVGLGSLPTTTAAAVVLLADEPTVTADAVRTVVAAWRTAPGTPWRAGYADGPGHPVLLRAEDWQAASEGGGDRGARDVLTDLGVREAPVPGPRPTDVDVPGHLERLAARIRATAAQVPGGPEGPVGTLRTRPPSSGSPVSEEIERLIGGSRRAFDKLFESRILFLKGPLEDDVADNLVAQLLALDAESDEDITLYINSPGGIITGMFALYDSVRLLRSKVNTRCLGLAASAAAFLLCTGTGTRAATESARIMIHQPLGGARGTAKDIEIQAKNIVWMRERINQIMAERTGQTLERIQQDTDRDFWMTAAEAKAYGLIDEVVKPHSGT